MSQTTFAPGQYWWVHKNNLTYPRFLICPLTDNSAITSHTGPILLIGSPRLFKAQIKSLEAVSGRGFE